MHILILVDEGVARNYEQIRKYIGLTDQDFMNTLATIYIGFEIKHFEINNERIKLNLTIVRMEGMFGREKYFRLYCSGSSMRGKADGVIIIYDISDKKSLDKITEWIQMVRKIAVHIPILLVGYKADLDKREISTREAMKIKEKFNLSEFFEIPTKISESKTNILGELVQLLSKKLEYKINKYLTLKLEYGKIYIYVNGVRFLQCIRLALKIPIETIPNYNEVDSIDEAAEVYDKYVWDNRIIEGLDPIKYTNDPHSITPEQEFWGHCSNLQAWVEFNYDTRIMFRNMAFPLLKELARAGDPQARRAFREEIAMRLESGHPSVVEYLIQENYLQYLSKEELKTVIESSPVVYNLLKKRNYKHWGFDSTNLDLNFLLREEKELDYNFLNKMISLLRKKKKEKNNI